MPTEVLGDPTVPVGRISARVLATVPAEATVRDVAEELVLDEVGLVAVEAGRFAAGVVSERDVVAVLAAREDPAGHQAADVMSTELLTVPPTASVAEAGRAMVRAGVRHVLVVEDGEVAGIVSMRDVLAVLLDVDG